MTFSKRLIATATAGAMLFTATAAVAAPAPTATARLSVTRAATPAANNSRLGAEVPRGTLISIGILAILIVVVLVATKGGGDNATSP